MATYYPKFYFYDAVGMAESKVKPEFHSRGIDFAIQNVNTSDVVNMLAIPAQTLVLFAGYQTMTTVASASATFVIASHVVATTFVASAAAVAAGSFGTSATISAATTNAFYAAKDDIQINTVAVANMTSGQIRVFAAMLYPQPTSYVDVDGTTHTYTYTDRNNWTTVKPVIS